MKTKSNPLQAVTQHFCILALLLVASLLSTSMANAASGTWTKTTGGNSPWATTGNWSGGTVASGTDSTADFSQANIAADTTVQLSTTARTIGHVIIGDTDGGNKYTVTSTSGTALTFDVSSGNASATQVSGSAANVISADMVLSDDVNFTNSANVGFNITGKITGAKTVNVSAPNTSNVTLNGGGNNAFSKLVVTAGNAAANRLIDDTAFGAVPASATADAITLNGGGLAIAGVNGTLTIHANRGITLGADGGTLNATSARLIIVNSVIAGTAGGSLKIAGSGTVTLTAANTYTGDTIVNPGAILRLTRADALFTATSVRLVSDAGSNHGKINLDFVGTQTINGLFFDGAAQVSGTWGSSASGADNQNDDWFTGTGVLNVSNLPTVATPTFDPDGGAHAGTSTNVTVSCVTADATIHYTTDGNDPTESDATVASGSTVSVPLPGTLKAKAWKTAMNPSGIKSASYIVATVATPTISPAGGQFPGSSVDVTVSCATVGSAIHYTTDGNDPTESDATVTSGGTVSVPLPATLKATAFMTGMIASAVKSASYTAITPVVWNLDNNGNWNNNANWLNSGPFPNGMNALADFSQLNITTAARTVTLGQNITIGSMLIGDTDGSHGYTFSGNVLTFDVSSGNASATQVAGSTPTSINSDIVLNDDVNFTNNAEFGFNIVAKITGAKTVNVSSPIGGNVVLGSQSAGAGSTYSKLVVTSGNAQAYRVSDDTAFGAVPASTTADAITLNGGGLRVGADGTVTIHANRGITLGANGGTLSSPNSARLLVVDSIIAGTAGGSLTIAGSGTVTLNATNTYTGDTRVNSGTLKLNNAEGLPSTTTVYLTNTAVLNLNFAGTDIVAAFYLDGVNQGNGTFNSSTHTNIFGTGALQVGSGSSSGTLTNVVVASGTNFFFNTGGSGSLVVQASTNLADVNAWVNLVTNTAPFDFTDTNAVNLYPQRFYRTKTP